MDKDEIISTREAGRRLGVSTQRILRLIKDGRLPARKIGQEWAIYATDLALLKFRHYHRPALSLPPITKPTDAPDA